MKQVTCDPPTIPTVPVDQVSIHKFYGTENSTGERGFITRKRYDSGDFFARSLRALTNGNGWHNYSKPSLPELISCLKDRPTPWDVYEFDTARELFTWLLEGEPK